VVKDDLPARKEVTPLIIAHRGASAHAPENTLAAFRLALEAGVDGIEFDVRLAADGVPMVIHDATLRRTGRRDGRISAMTSDELGRVDVGSWFNSAYPRRAREEFAGEPVPTLVSALELLAPADVSIYIELKCDRADPTKLAASVCDVLRHSPLLPRIIVKSFDLNALNEVRRVLERAHVATLFQLSAGTLVRPGKIIRLATEIGARQISVHRSLARPRLARLCVEAGLPLIVWTVDDIRWLAKAHKLGIAGLITNDPARLIAHRAGQHR